MNLEDHVATYDPKRVRNAVGAASDEPAPVDAFLEVGSTASVSGEAESSPPVVEEAPMRIEVSPSPFEPAGPPDRRVAQAIAIGVTAAGVLALMTAWRRRA